jgi:ketosteroid isomerase-like protein
VVEPAVDGRTAEKDAKGLVAEIYATIERGNTDSLFSLLADPIVVFGPRRTDAVLSRSDALVTLGKILDAKTEPKPAKGKKHAPLHSGGLEVVASEGGHSAWVFDVIRIDGQQLAATAVLSNTDDLWTVIAASLAETPTGKQVKAEAAREAIVPPGATSAAKIAPGADAAVEKFKKGLVDQQAWGDDLASRSDAIVVGPTAGEVARGKAPIKRQWKARMTANVREATSGEIAAAMTADGQLVWISAPVTRVADGESAMPLRIFAVYEKDGAGWKMIALHEALALDEPGSGAAWKKTLPPAPLPPAPEPAKAEPTDKKPNDKNPDATVAAKKKPAAKKKKPKKPRTTTTPPPPPE